MLQLVWISFLKKKRLDCLYTLSPCVISFLEGIYFNDILKKEVPESSFLTFYEIHFTSNFNSHTLSKLPVYPPYYTGSHMPEYTPWMIDGYHKSSYQIYGTQLKQFFNISEHEANILDNIFDEFDQLLLKP